MTNNASPPDETPSPEGTDSPEPGRTQDGDGSTHAPATAPEHDVDQGKSVDAGTAPPPRTPIGIPGWDALSGMSGIAGALLAAAALVVAVLAWLVPNSAAPAAPDLEVVSAEVARLQEVGIDPEGRPTFDIGRNNVQDLAIDVQLFNRGGTPVLIDAITADVLVNQGLDLCPKAGGYVGANMLYDFRIPADPDDLNPVTVRRPFQVAPNSYDRLSVTVGPYGSFLPRLYVVRLHAALAGSDERLDLGTFSLINPVSSLGRYYAEAYSGDAVQEECIRNNSQYFRHAAAFGGTTAPEVTTLSARFDEAVRRLDAGQPLHAPGNDSDPPASRGLPRCTEANLPTVLHYEVHADVTGDGRTDVLLAQACESEAAPNDASFFDGGDPETRQVLLTTGDGVDDRGLAMVGFSVSDGVVSVWGSAFRESDTEPSLTTTDTFIWDGVQLARQGERTCELWTTGEPQPCSP